jgi:hypothetical protein
VFIDDRDFERRWQSTARYYLLAAAASGGKFLFTNL